MGLSQLTGTSWHIETLHKKEGVNSRHKNKCRFYNKGYCSKRLQNCYGSSFCSSYLEKKVSEEFSKNIERKMKKNKNIIGTFVLKYSNNSIRIFTIGIDIRHDNPLVKKIYRSKEHCILEYGGESFEIVSKNLTYN